MFVSTTKVSSFNTTMMSLKKFKISLRMLLDDKLATRIFGDKNVVVRGVSLCEKGGEGEEGGGEVVKGGWG